MVRDVRDLLVELLPGIRGDRRPDYPGGRPSAPSAMSAPVAMSMSNSWAHFAQVTKNYLRYLRDLQLPAWEVPNMIVKYETIMQAYRMSR